MIQRTDEWFAARCGRVTASRVVDILLGARGSYLAARENYMAELVCERITGQPYERGFETAAMRWGTDTEDEARACYEAVTGNVVEEVGFIDHPTIPGFGASPDGLIGTGGGLEIKCPNTATLISLLRGGQIERRYMVQMQVGLMCTGREWWDFFCYDPRMPDGLNYYLRTIAYDEALAEEIKKEVAKFEAELVRAVEVLLVPRK